MNPDVVQTLLVPQRAAYLAALQRHAPSRARSLHASIDFSTIQRALRNAYDATAEIERFLETVQIEAIGRARTVGDSDTFRVAAYQLVPLRKYALRRHLLRLRVDVPALRDFLGLSHALATDAIEAAADADEIADAVIAAADDLYAYLVAHDLVSPSSVAFEQRVAEGWLDAEAGEAEVAGDERGLVDDETPVAADNELALAA